MPFTTLAQPARLTFGTLWSSLQRGCAQQKRSHKYSWHHVGTGTAEAALLGIGVGIPNRFVSSGARIGRIDVRLQAQATHLRDSCKNPHTKLQQRSSSWPGQTRRFLLSLVTPSNSAKSAPRTTAARTCSERKASPGIRSCEMPKPFTRTPLRKTLSLENHARMASSSWPLVRFWPDVESSVVRCFKSHPQNSQQPCATHASTVKLSSEHPSCNKIAANTKHVRQ